MTTTQPTPTQDARPALSVYDVDAALEETARALQTVQAAGGDTRRLTPEHRERVLFGLCRALGLNPLTSPIIYLTLNGKEVIYVTRQATDQIAARLRLNRETIAGPEIRDFAGTKLLFCQVRVTAPDGRSEVATATLPPIDLVNALMKCECVPLDSEILTRRGFKRHDEVRIGEEVLAYDAARDRSEWVPLENVTTYPSAPVATFATARGGFSFRCTPNHSWAVDTNTRAGRQLIEAQHVKTHHHLRIAAPAEGGAHPLSAELAAVLGWVMCDGTIKRVGNNLRLVIYQSKQDRVAEIRDLLARSGLAWQEGVGEATVRTFPGGSTYDCLPQHSFRLTTASSKALFDGAGVEGPTDLPRLVASLSTEARRALLNAMMAADGTADGTFGKKRKPGVMEAWQILCTLEGIALGKMGASSVGDVPVQRMLSYDYVAGNNLALTPAGEEPVWCPTTKHGTWVMRQGGRITITGNTKAKRRATLSLAGLGMLSEDDVEGIPVDQVFDRTPIADVEPSEAQAKFDLDLADCTVSRDVVTAWLTHRDALTRDGEVVRSDAFDAAVTRVRHIMEVPKTVAAKFIRAAIAERDEQIRAERAAAGKPEETAPPTEVQPEAPKVDAPVVLDAPTLADFNAQLGRCGTLDAVANLWRACRFELVEGDRVPAWTAAIVRLAAVMKADSIQGMGAMLKRRIADLDTPTDPRPDGTDGPARDTPPPADAHGSAAEGTTSAAPQASAEGPRFVADGAHVDAMQAAVEASYALDARAWDEHLAATVAEQCAKGKDPRFALAVAYAKRRFGFVKAGGGPLCARREEATVAAMLPYGGDREWNLALIASKCTTRVIPLGTAVRGRSRAEIAAARALERTG